MRRAVVVLLLLAGCAGSAEPPGPDLAGMEPDVAELLSRGREAVLEQPDSGDAWGRYGAALHAHGLLEESSACYRRATELAPGDFRWPYLLAVARDRANAGAEELTDLYQAAAKLRPDYAPLFLRSGLALARVDRHAEAAVALRRVIELDPASALGRRTLGQALLATGDTEQAREQLEEAARLRPADAAVHSALARVYADLGDDDASRRAAQRARLRVPAAGFEDPLYEENVLALGASAALRLQRAQRRIADGDFDAAAIDLERVIALRPEEPDAYMLLGLAAIGQQRVEEAWQNLTHALQIDPSHVPARSSLAHLYERQGQLDEAVEQRRLAHESSPRDPSLIVALARTHGLRGDLDGTIEAYETLAGVLPDVASVRLDLGVAYREQGDFERSIVRLGEALELDPSLVNAHYLLGLSLKQLGRGEEAQQHFAAAVRIDPSHIAGDELAR